MNKTFTVAITIFIAMALSILPLPQWIAFIWPQWVLLVLLYWSVRMPHTISVGWAFTVGILLDLLTGTLVGAHALALTGVVYISSKFFQRMQHVIIWQQIMMVLLLVIGYQAALFWIHGLATHLSLSPWLWLSAISSAVIWPWLQVLLNTRRMRAH